MKQLSAANISDLRARKIDIYVTIIISIALGLATLTPVEKLPTVSGSDKAYQRPLHNSGFSHGGIFCIL